MLSRVSLNSLKVVKMLVLTLSLLLLLVISRFGELINCYSPRNHQKTFGFLMISMRIEVNLFIGLILDANLETVPYLTGFDLTFQK